MTTDATDELSGRRGGDPKGDTSRLGTGAKAGASGLETSSAGWGVDKWVILGVSALLLAAVGTPQVFRYLGQTAPPPSVDPDPPAKPSRAGEYRGIALQVQSCEAAVPFEQFVEEIANTGANTILLSVTAHQEKPSSSSLFMDYRRMPSVERLERLINRAHELGLRVVLMPIVLLENPDTGDWRGKIQPKDPDHWWGMYGDYIVFYAQIAQKTNVEVFMVGSELVLLEEYADRWRALIAKVRDAYEGRLSYSANWDHYTKIEWWHELDLVGMTSYYDLVGDKKPSLDVLLETWKPIKQDVLAWQKTVNRPIMFTEAGWPSQEGCAKEPWNYYGSTTPDLVTQDLCFKAFFQTWKDEPTVAGVIVWEWRNSADQLGGPDSIDYTPVNKPALKTIREYFQTPGAYAGTQPASAPASRPAPAETPVAENTPVE